jgi:hypothetical protein
LFIFYFVQWTCVRRATSIGCYSNYWLFRNNLIKQCNFLSCVCSVLIEVWKKRKTFFDNCFFTFLGPKRKTCVYQVSVPIFFLHRFSLFCFWKRVHPKKKMLQFPERKYCFLRLDFNTASLIPILECQAACFFNLKH